MVQITDKNILTFETCTSDHVIPQLKPSHVCVESSRNINKKSRPCEKKLIDLYALFTLSATLEFK